MTNFDHRRFRSLTTELVDSLTLRQLEALPTCLRRVEMREQTVAKGNELLLGMSRLSERMQHGVM